VKQQYLTVGKVGASHGLKGWMKVHSYTAPFTNILDYQPWQLLAENGSCQMVKVACSRVQGKNLLVQLEHCSHIEHAQQHCGDEIRILRSQLPQLPSDEYYWTDLEGLNAYTETGIHLGVVDHLFEAGADAILVVEGQRRHMIPFVLDVLVKEINLEKQTIVVNWDPNA
jgi:16S rRNA processing protein RimM